MKDEDLYGHPYPIICPGCGGSYYTWLIMKETKWNLTGEYSKEIVASIDYIHDDGMVCSRKPEE